LEKFNNHLNEFVLVDLDNNLIASRGCKFLSKGNWPKLE